MIKISATEQSNISAAFTLFYEECFTTAGYGVIFCLCIMSLCFLVGTPAHLWCLWFYLRDGWRIKANQMFQFHHIIIELISCVETSIQLLNEFVFRDETVFVVDNFIFGVSWTGRPLIQTCICIEQYIAVIHPIIFLKYKDIKYKLAGVATVYLISLGYGVYVLTHWMIPDPVFNFLYFVVVILMLFCCVSVLCALRKSGPGDKHTNRSTTQEEPNQQKKKAFNIICTNLFIMLFTYVPMLILTVCYVIKDDYVLFYCILNPILSSMSFFSLIITPLLNIYNKFHLRCLNRMESNVT